MARGRKASGDPLAHLESEGPKPVYAVDGEERILVDEAVTRIRDKALEGVAADFNLDVFIAKETPVSRIVDAANTLPAFAARRLVIVKDAHKIPAADGDALIRYFESPSPTTVLLLIADKFDARTKLTKAMKKAAVVVRMDRPKERDMPALVERRARAAGIEFERGAVRALVDSLGADLGGTVGAIEKLALYVDPSSGRPVTTSDVDEVVSPAKEESIFAFADAVGSNDTRRALNTLHGMLQGTRGYPLGILGMIARHWRRLTQARSLIDSGASRGDLQSGFGLPPFVVDKLLAQAKQQSRPGLIRGLRAIAEADQALKGGKLAGSRVMERLVLTLTRT